MNSFHAFLYFLLISSQKVEFIYGGQIKSCLRFSNVDKGQECLSTPTQIHSIPHQLWKSQIQSRMNVEDLLRLSQSSKYFNQLTSEEREAWKGIYRACSEGIASSLRLWNDERLNRALALPSSFSSTFAWYLNVVPTKKCVDSWQPLCSLDYRIPIVADNVELFEPELMNILPACFLVEGVFLSGQWFPNHKENWDRLMQWISPSDGAFSPSQKIRSIALFNDTAEPLSPEQELLFSEFLGDERNSLQSFTTSRFVFSPTFTQGWVQLLRHQLIVEWHLHLHHDILSPEFLFTTLNALKTNRSLKKLSITFSQLSQRSLRALTDMISENKVLEEFNAMYNEIGENEKELMALVQASLSHPRLKVLNLSGNGISSNLVKRMNRMVFKAKRLNEFSVS